MPAQKQRFPIVPFDVADPGQVQRAIPLLEQLVMRLEFGKLKHGSGSSSSPGPQSPQGSPPESATPDPTSPVSRVPAYPALPATIRGSPETRIPPESVAVRRPSNGPSGALAAECSRCT